MANFEFGAVNIILLTGCVSFSFLLRRANVMNIRYRKDESFFLRGSARSPPSLPHPPTKRVSPAFTRKMATIVPVRQASCPFFVDEVKVVA